MNIMKTKDIKQIKILLIHNALDEKAINRYIIIINMNMDMTIIPIYIYIIIII